MEADNINIRNADMVKKILFIKKKYYFKTITGYTEYLVALGIKALTEAPNKITEVKP